jgi:hypothetical protein
MMIFTTLSEVSATPIDTETLKLDESVKSIKKIINKGIQDF